jgi:osmotically-inducible protein OsmY
MRLGLIWLLAGLGLLLCGCNHDDAERLARVSQKAAAHVLAAAPDAGNKLRNGWQGVRGGSLDAALDARVALRLQWDKDLADTSITVTAVDGVVELKGTVQTLAQRQKAITLAQSTAGVTQVTDSLQQPAQDP